jgi:hypothetical protein
MTVAETGVVAELGDHRVMTDEQGRAMPFIVRPARKPSKARTLVILHGHGSNKQFAKFRSHEWNVICPLDRYGVDGHGTWWLGEGGDHFVLRLLHRIIAQVRAELGGDTGLYFYGSSMGGYGAILHGLLLGARAIYADVPQTRLRGSMYSDRTLARFFAAVRGPQDGPYDDLAVMLKSYQPAESPVFFLSFNRFDHPRYLAEQCRHFITACDRLSFNYHLEIHPVRGHGKLKTVAESVILFDEYDDAITDWSAPRSEHDAVFSSESS